MDGWGNLETHEKHTLLTLNTNVLWPLDEASEISYWLDVSSDSEIAWIFREKRILILLRTSLRSTCCYNLLALGHLLDLNTK